MALTNWVGLITAVGDFTSRSDMTTAKVDYFIDLAENWFNNNLRVHEMETTNGSLTVSSGLISHPADFLGWKNIGVTSNGKRTQLKPITLEQRSIYAPDGSTDTPSRYVVRGTSTLLVPTPDSGGYSYDGTYYQKIPALSDTQSTNWIMSNYADAYLYGTLAMTESFIQNDPRISLWKELFAESVKGIKSTSDRKGSGQVMTMASDYPIY